MTVAVRCVVRLAGSTIQTTARPTRISGRVSTSARKKERASMTANVRRTQPSRTLMMASSGGTVMTAQSATAVAANSIAG